jgi:acyl-CoA thioester hydrolase
MCAPGAGVTLASEEFNWPVRVYYEDTDSAGIVYHASYLRFMERARTEWLRSLGLELPMLRAEHDVLFTVSRLRIDYLQPAHFNDMLDVSLSLTRFGGASFLLDQKVCRTPRELLCRAEVRIACVDAMSLRPRPIPLAVCAELKRDC